MKIHSIKFKITCWYTCIIVLVFSIVWGGAFAYSEYYGEDSIKVEVLDEIKDLQEDMMRYPDYFPDRDLMSFYDDGIMLSIYDTDFELINGILPDGFPTGVRFENGSVQKVQVGEDNWFFSDKRTEMPDGSEIWIRGIHSYSPIVMMVRRLTTLLCIMLPLLIVFTAFVGYRMIHRCLSPIRTITQTANEITSSSSLSKRLPMQKTKDEFYGLCSTINQMFDNLEQTFQRESQFSSDAAHELRTPVAVILSHCEYCLEEVELTEEARAEIKIIQKKAMQMSELVSQLLAISRTEKLLQKPDFDEVDLSILAESVTEELEEKAAVKNISLEVVNHLDDPVIWADMSLITRMFINLIDNAIIYGKEDGFVKIYMDEEKSGVSIRFQDNGVGIPENALDKIWDRFYQADPSRSMSQGFGLGLFMVKYIVECHQGTVKVSSRSSEGTEFIVRLPRVQERL